MVFVINATSGARKFHIISKNNVIPGIVWCILWSGLYGCPLGCPSTFNSVEDIGMFVPLYSDNVCRSCVTGAGQEWNTSGTETKEYQMNRWGDIDFVA